MFLGQHDTDVCPFSLRLDPNCDLGKGSKVRVQTDKDTSIGNKSIRVLGFIYESYKLIK